MSTTGASTSGHAGETSFDPNNLSGQLFMRGKRDNPTLQLIGGLNGISGVKSRDFDCGQDYEIPDHATLPERIEGAAAPTFAAIERQPTKNTLEILHETIAATYTQRGTSQQLTQGAGIVINGGAVNPVADEFEFQAGVVMEKMTRQMNYRLLNQVYQNPSVIGTARKTRGLRDAIVTNVVDAEVASVPQPITRKHFDSLFVEMINSGAVTDGDDIVLLSNTAQIARINELYSGYNHGSGVPTDRTVGGVRIRTIYTAFGYIHLVLERDLPQDELLYVNFGVVGLKGLVIPGKPGFIFREKLAKRGSVDEEQIYGEIGLDHGMEWMHGKIVGLETA